MAHYAAPHASTRPSTAHEDATSQPRQLVGPRPSSPSRILKRARQARMCPPTPPSTPSLRAVSSGSRRRRHLHSVCSNAESVHTPLSELSDSEFRFSSPLSSDGSGSDSESLPDLFDSVPGSSTESPATPVGGRSSYFETYESPLKRLSSAPVLRSALLHGVAGRELEAFSQPNGSEILHPFARSVPGEKEQQTLLPEANKRSVSINCSPSYSSDNQLFSPSPSRNSLTHRLQLASGKHQSQRTHDHQNLQPLGTSPFRLPEVQSQLENSPFVAPDRQALSYEPFHPFASRNLPSSASYYSHLKDIQTSEPFPSQDSYQAQPWSSDITFHQPSIFEIPELVHQIIVFADAQNTVVPKEKTPVCRKPLSFRHAMLVHGNEKAAKLAMEGAFSMENDAVSRNRSNVLHTCLLVNKLFHRIAKEVLGEKLFFTDMNTLNKFTTSVNPENPNSGMVTKQLVVSKMFLLRQSQFTVLAAKTDLRKLEWLELYMCPRLTPTVKFLSPSLKTLIVTGSKALDDSVLVEVARTCPNLETLDVRACENVTDHGIHSIGQSCKKLVTLNLGRKKRGHLITDHSVCAVAANNPNLTTVGVAGCYITDRSIWQLALTCGKRLERLSLNNCPYITDQSVPTVLDHNLLRKLTVLEIRFVDKITNFKPIITYRRRQAARGYNVLVETCEELLMRMREQERTMDRTISERVVNDISEWANGKDEDMAAADLFRARGRRSA